jgi:hypothetical protein
MLADEHWNEWCEPPWSLEERLKLASHAYAYLMGYLAHMIQRPWEKPLVALVTGTKHLIEHKGKEARTRKNLSRIVILGTWRVEAVDPDTVEVVDVPPARLGDSRQRALEVWGENLETNPTPRPGQALPGRVVGVPCGKRGKYRRVGALPFAGPGPTVREFERKGAAAITGIRGLLVSLSQACGRDISSISTGWSTPNWSGT